MKILFIGGTGLISTAVVKESLKRGYDVYLLNRGHKALTFDQPVHQIICDVHDDVVLKEKIKDLSFDVVIDFIAFEEDDVKRDYEVFKGHTKHYIFISSASAYQKPVPYLPIDEKIPLDNPYWTYSQNKAKAEAYLNDLNDDDFKVTIVRPSHTYNEKSMIFQLKSGAYPYTMIDRMKKGLPVILPDDGNLKWTLTYNEDFACAFVDLFKNEKAYGDVFHLTSDLVFTWNEITLNYYKILRQKPNIIYMPIDFILRHFPEFRGELLGDKMVDAIFDNEKIKKVAPNYVSKTSYLDVANDVIDYYESHTDLQDIDIEFTKRYEACLNAFQEKEVI